VSPAAERRAHERARERGVSRPLYALARVILAPPLRLWFRVRATGAEHVPGTGAAILAPNHKSFLDPFFLGLVMRRPVRFMAKVEMFRGPLARLLVRLGAFPVRRGEADADAVETARRVLAEGGLVVVFLEGTRVDEADVLGSPHHGAGRLALETGAPIIPVAISGTANLWLGPVPKPRVVRIAFLPAVEVPAPPPSGPDALEELIDRDVWPAVQHEYGRLAATPGPIVAALAALGIGGAVVSRRLRGGDRTPRLIGFVEPRRVRRQSRLSGLRRGLAQHLHRR
jgi:1-acyl-sn-glycerol-3-phosphate acyltransferase